MPSSRLIFLLLIITTSTWQSVQAEIYRWKDENGKIHFSDKPHADATQLNIKPQKPAGIGSSNKQIKRQKALLNDFQEKREREQEQASQAKKQRVASERNCSELKNRLKDYQEADYLYDRDGSGERQNLSDERKQHEEQRLRDQIAERC